MTLSLAAPGNDTLTGGAGDDILIGGGGLDILDGGPGNNILINSIIAHSAPVGVLSQLMESSFATTADTHGVSPLIDPQTSYLAQLAHPHA